MRLSLLLIPFVLGSITPAGAESPASEPGITLAQLFRTPHRSIEGRMRGRAGQRGIRTTHWIEPKKTKQDIADERKLAHDLHICTGC